MFAGFAVAVVVEALGERFLGWGGLLCRPGPQVLGVLAGIVVIFAVGVLDDIVDAEPRQKLLGQLVAAGVAIAAGLRIDFVGNPFGGGLVALGLLAYPITLFWIVGFTNVINLIDGLDGLAAGVSAIAAASFLVLAAQSRTSLAAAVLAAALVGACIGFLRYNFNPASIFMGDSGAMFLGFTLACDVASRRDEVGRGHHARRCRCSSSACRSSTPFSAIIRRMRHGRPIQEADKGHIHHRLLGRGFNQRQTVLIIYVWSIALAVGRVRDALRSRAHQARDVRRSGGSCPASWRTGSACSRRPITTSMKTAPESRPPTAFRLSINGAYGTISPLSETPPVG